MWALPCLCPENQKPHAVLCWGTMNLSPPKEAEDRVAGLLDLFKELDLLVWVQICPRPHADGAWILPEGLCPAGPHPYLSTDVVLRIEQKLRAPLSRGRRGVQMTPPRPPGTLALLSVLGTPQVPHLRPVKGKSEGGKCLWTIPGR